ncbi:MAG: hypothetical protein P1U87_18705 [Verrucomicrobiales bacterium]|nr:hypothetical protein [Verrucomicrobiales bacterium]
METHLRREAAEIRKILPRNFQDWPEGMQQRFQTYALSQVRILERANGPAYSLSGAATRRSL